MRRRGLGLFEMLISLVIVALLLTAVGGAFQAATQAYQINQEQSSLIQRARLSMNRMLMEIRNGSSQFPYSATPLAQFAVGVIVNDTGITLVNTAGAALTYRYDAPNQQILCTDAAGTHTMLAGVSAFQLTLQPMQSPTSLKTAGPFDLLERATITLSVQTTDNTVSESESTDNQTVTLSSSVMPRKNCW